MAGARAGRVEISSAAENEVADSVVCGGGDAPCLLASTRQRARAVAQNGAAVRRPQRTRAAPILINGACRPPMLIETPNFEPKTAARDNAKLFVFDGHAAH